MKHFEFLIIGQGLAGTVLTYDISRYNKTFLVISNNDISSSKVAAGMFTPVGGKRMIKTWLAEQILNESKRFYEDFEKSLNANFYHSQDIVQFFQNNGENIQVEERFKESEYLKYLEANNKIYPLLHQTLGQVTIKEGGWLDIKKMIDSFTNLLQKEFCQKEPKILFEYFDYSHLIFKENKYFYKNFSFDKVIFCEGYQAINNPYFNYLPFQPSKGEVLIIKTKEKISEEIFKKGIYLVHLENNFYKVGATNEWKNLKNNPTEKGLEYLKDKLNNLIKTEYEIISHQAGIRPNVMDKKPLLGQHPEFKNIFIFNGLGTKGVMLAPYFAKILLNSIFNKIDLPDEVDIERFLKYYRPHD